MSNFKIIEHFVRAQHSRDRFAGAELGRENELKLHVKQYIPLNNAEPQPGDVTIIGAVANAFPKEMHEPLWDELYQNLAAKGQKIRSIWIADPVNQGQSGVMNEEILGPDPSWLDHGRDLLFLINQFQDEIPHPIIGIGHSMGACHLAHLSLLHPRLFHALILIDPVFADGPAGTKYAAMSLNRRDVWPSRSIAASKMRSNPAFTAWDPRVLELYIRHGLRDLPSTASSARDLSRDQQQQHDGPPVTLQTTKAQEQYNYIRAAYPQARYLHSGPAISQAEEQQGASGAPSTSTSTNSAPSFTRSENLLLHASLPHLRPAVLYIVGQDSEVSTPGLRAERLARTGTAHGSRLRRPAREVVLSCGHLVPFEKTREAGAACARFVGAEAQRWGLEERSRRERWEGLSRVERREVDGEWRERLGRENPETMERGRRIGEERPAEKL